MNKIYKVVWNKAKNCYVVASEFAKNHQTGSSRIKAASVAAVMAAAMLTAAGADIVYASSSGGNEQIQFTSTTNEKTGLKNPDLKHINPLLGDRNGHTDTCGERIDNTTLKIGDINKVTDDLVYNDDLLYNQGIQKVTMNNGTISLIRNDNSRVTDSIALTGNGGKNGEDTSVTVRVGNESQTFQTGSVVTANTDNSGKATGLTINGTSYDINAGKTYKAGENVTIADDGTISATDTTYSAGKNVKIDDKNKISVDLSEYAKSDDVAVVYQDNDKNKSLHSTNAGTVGSSSIALGKEATTGKWSVALGDQTKATGERSTAIGVKAEATALDSIAIGGGTKATGGDSIAIGNATTANSQYSVAIGDDIQFTGTSATAVGQQAHATGDYSTALGSMTNVDAVWNGQHPGEWRKSGKQSTAIGYGSGSWGDYSTALGAFAKTENQFNSAIGYNSQATAENAIALGAVAKAEGKFATAIGTSSQATAENAVALGGAATANVYGGVALGTSSVANRAAEADVVGAFAPEGADSLTWRANGGAVSVGSATLTRQITNVAAGSEATDAVNVAQLQAATEYVNNQIAGVTLTEGKGISITDKKINVKLKDGEQNLVVNEDGLSMNTTLKGIQSITGAGTGAGSISFEGSNVKVNQNTFNSDGRIQGVAAGKDNTDAVNVGQLNNVVAAGDTDVHIQAGNYTVDKNNKVSMNLVDKAGNNEGTVTITGVAKAEDVAVVYDANGSLKSTNAKSVESNAIALGKDASAVKDGGVALGNEAYAGNKGTSLGTKAKSGREGATVVGYNTNSSGLYSTVVGTDAVINTDRTAYQTPFKDVIVQGAAATVVGSKNTVDNKNKKVYSGVANNIMGAANTIKASNGITIQGSGNTVTDAYKDMDIDFKEGLAILGGDYSVLAKKQSGAVAVVGGANNVSKQTDSTVIGYDNKLTGDEEKGSHDVFMAGSHNKLNNVSDSIVMGNENAITGVSNVISFGHQNAISADNAVAIGNGAGVSVEGGVALGVGSVADRAAEVVGYGAAEGETGIAWKATNGAVSVGSSVEGKKITRQITNVAAGTEDTDAVNVAQLKKVSEAAASASQGWKLKTKKGNASDVKPGDEVEFDGDANIQVSNDGNKVSVALKNQLTGIQSITGAGEGAGSISFANGGIKFNNKVAIDNNGKISGVADGKISADSKEAVNGSQLNAVATEAGKHTTLSNGKNTTVKTVTTADGHLEYKVDVNDELKDIKSIIGAGESAGSISFADGGIKINNKVTINKDGKITGVAAGAITETSTDAVNGSQLHAVATEAGKHTTLSNGKNTTVNPVTTADGHLEYKVDVNDELKDIKSIIGAGEGAGSISFADGGIKINNKVTINKDGKITGVAAGVEKTDAVNVGQLTDYVAANDTHIKSGNYAVGEVTDSTGNKSQGVSMDIVNKEGKVTGTVTITDVAKASDVGEVNNIDSDIKNQNGSHTTVVDAVNNLNQKLNNKVGDLNYVEGGKGNYVTNGENTTTSIGKLDQALKDVAATAAKHTTVTQGDNITVTPETNTDGSKNYNVALKKDITVESVTANTFKADQTVMNKDGLKVGNKVSVSATAVTAGKTSISDEGVKVGDKTYISDKGLNANDQKVTNVAAGELSATSKDAVNGSQLYETNQAIANNATNISSLSHSISNLDNRVNKVGAGAAALAALHPLDFDPDAKWDFAAGYGNYRGANAAAVGAYYRPNEDTMFSVGGTFGNGENMVNVGVSFKLGSGSSHVSTSRVAMAKEIKELRGELEAMKSAMLDANAGKKIDTSKLQLFPDVPQNHWAYEYVAQLAGDSMIEGYPDGNFAGDRPMTRYEFAAILYRAMTKGAVLSDKILSEFSHELEYFTVDTIAKDKAGNPTIQRVRTVKKNKNK
ncbi:ESPR-type extended signal peptide-containing protein [Mitsuokella jalaludinii]|uniref:ESPR-type extended signal peptide-containing protein n=1 Tax=Mitsuokella jalaludinii TaxID=187979 RepID=UPI003F8AD0AC